MLIWMMLKRLFLLTIFLMFRAFAINFYDHLGEGEKYYVELERKSQSYGECWKSAMSNLHTGCKQLTEELQSRLALSFANCFLEHAGRVPCICAYDVSIADCLHNCSDQVFSTYTEFFTHTQSVCHYLQHREWQVETAKTALLLAENSLKISQKLDESAQSQSKILDLQQASLNEQKRSISNGRILNAELQRSRENARVLFNEFKSTTYEQKLLLFEMFDRMKNLQNFVLGEFTGVYTIAYYLIIATLVYILSSVPRTAEARIWLILIISLNAVSEKFLTSYTLKENSVEINPVIISELLHERIWLCRKIACLICTIILVIFYYRYKDYNIINNELLREIQRQNMELQNFIKGLTFHENIHNFAPTHQSPIQDRKTIIKTLSGKTEFNKQSPRQGTKVKNKNVENKENSFTSVSDLEDSSKRTPNRKYAAVVKNSLGKNKENAARICLAEQKNLSSLESPRSPSGTRYNLRSSSRFNSPVSSP